ncbi:uncharacterized protein LOC134187305 [Corticium candelabrum]|uniref:uncharacterized protein LOC134187305 n=1 Tax=Corticium candelabrum TaxID=121492 RepID=UPI002E26C741|nr:uncharacterized protein LOC134187305 [Corticium candelabrum]
MRLLCLPSNVWNGLNLWRLDLSNCGIESVPNTEVTIKEVNISGTSVTHLPKEFVFSSKLKELKVDGCPLVFPPIEVCNRGIDSIREYFRDLDKVGGVRRGRIKILVMGTTMAGKTSFVEALESGKPFLAEPDERTIGVVEKVMKLDDKIECKLLDSGGHRAYMLTNQLFISDNSLVLIVVDSNQYKFTQQCFRQNIADFLQVVYDRNSRAHIAIVVSKVDLMVDMSREEMSRKWSEHLDTCLRQFLKIRRAEIDRMKEIVAAGDSPKNKYVSERLHFFDFQRISVDKNVLLTSASTHEGMVSVKNRLRELCGNAKLLPSLHTELPSSWVTVEDELIKPQPHTFVPITDVSYAMQLCVEHGLTEESCRELLNYLNQVGSILYYSHHPTLAEVLFPVPPFVVSLLKAVFRHDHESLKYDDRFSGVNIGSQKFKEMRNDLVFNGIARISMLLALWSEFHLTADRHVDVFIKLFLALDFGYLTGSSDVVQELAHPLGRRQITLTPPSSTNPTSDLSGHTIEQNRHQEQTDCCKEMISKLKQHNVGLLLPWLLNDEKPEDVNDLWPLDIPHGVMQVAVEYSFAYDCPLGVFERLSARCHRHSNFICHWSSGLLMCYGAVTLLINCSKNTSPGSICLSGRVVKSHYSVGRLWHVLLRCVSDMEDLLQSVPGVLPDRFIYSGSSSSTSRKSLLRRPKQFVPNESWGTFAVDAVAGKYSAEMSKHIQAVQQVCPSVKKGISLCHVLSSESATPVDRLDLHQIAADVGEFWPNLTSIIFGSDQSMLSKLQQNISDSSFVQPPAFRILSEWLESRDNQLMVCELYDALLVARIPSEPQKHLSYLMLPDAASEKTTPPGDSDRVTPLIKEIVAENVGHRWHELGIYLAVSEGVLRECERQIYTYKEKLHKVLSAWTGETQHATVQQLLVACDNSGVGGIVRREIKSKLGTN